MADTITTFQELANLWYEQHTYGLSYSYQRDLLCKITHLINYLGELELSEIKPYHIDGVIVALAKYNPSTKKPTSKKTLMEIAHTARRIFEFAVDNDFVTKNPARNAINAVPKNAPKKYVPSITQKEQQLVLNTKHRCQLPAMIMMLTGLRVSELLALEWTDVDLVNKSMYIHQHAVKVAANRFEVKPGTKNNKCRYVSIPDNLMEILVT